jgi:hypothetical protein
VRRLPSPGGVAPFSLLTYQDASKRAQLIATITEQARHAAVAAEPRIFATSAA